ncbi:MAG: GTPase Era [Alphaproteobacteria bacterium]
MNKKCGVVAVIGEPNAGKSTLVNQLVGSKVSIVTPKVQTTRFNVRGVCIFEQTQFIFVDTPGIFDATKQFEKAMVNAAWAGMGDADAALLIIDGTKPITDAFKLIIEQLIKSKKPIFLAINKIDKLKKDKVLELMSEYNALANFSGVFMISALKGSGIEYLKEHLARAMPASEWLYPEDEMTDIPVRMLAAEITREKLFFMLGQELPYAILVETEQWEEKENIVRISQAIYVQRESQKMIVIGKGGAMLKRIGTSSRRELEALLEKKVHLSLFVKIRENWKEDQAIYRMMGLEYHKS